MVGNCLNHIILITYANFPFGGASANLLRCLSIGLSRLDNIVEVILPTGGGYGEKIDINKNKVGNIKHVSYKHLGFTIHPRNNFGKITDNLIGVFSPFFYLIRKSLKNEVDVVIRYNTSFFSLFICLLFKTLCKKKIILILPEFYEKPKKKLFFMATIKWYSFYFSMKYLIRYADGFIVLSNYLKNYVKSRLKRSKPIFIMPNLVDPKRFDIGSIPPYLEDKITIGYVGTPTRKDGIYDLIKSFSFLVRDYSNLHLMIIGDITNGNSIVSLLKARADELGIDDDSITFTGLVSTTDVPNLLMSCQILALTRPNGIFAEAGFPTKLGEYMSCRKPILLTKVGDIPNYFTDEKEVFLAEPENISSIVSKFERIIENKKLSEQVAINGYNWMIDNLEYSTQAPKLNNFLSKVIES